MVLLCLTRTVVIIAVMSAVATVMAWSPPRTIYNCSTAATHICRDLTDLLHWANVNRTAASIAAAATTTRDARLSYIATAGRYTYSDSAAETTADSRFDMASCSKIMGVTTAAAQLYQSGLLDLDAKVTVYLGEGFGAHGKDAISIRNLLLHNAGYPPDPVPGYSSQSFACPETQYYHPGQAFSCQDAILSDLMYNQTLVYPVGTKYIYSDLSFITLMFVIGSIAKTHQLVTVFPPDCLGYTDTLVCHYWALVKASVFDRYGLNATDYVPTSALVTPPAWEDTWYRHKIIMGFVSDENAYAMGGVSGHAGIFTTVRDALRFVRVWADATETDPFLNATTVRLFTTVANLSQSSRALGWDTNDQSHPPCGTMSPKAYLHLGYTGTQLCVDPVAGVATVLLTNSRYPNYNVDLSMVLRPMYNTLVMDLLQGR